MSEAADFATVPQVIPTAPKKNRAETAGGETHPMKALRALVVEDDAIIGGLLAETLEGLGHTVCAVERNAADAVAAALRWRPDLMIVDVGLAKQAASRRSGRSAQRVCPARVRDRRYGARHVAGR